MGDVKTGSATTTKTRAKTRRPRLYKVILLNDDFTTMDFVVSVLQSIFNHNLDDAVRIMLEVHRQGQGVAGIFTREIAEVKSVQTMQLARSHGYPLRCKIEPQ
ncbi:MAG: ATP-dependent Clp protease adapter ClpS [Lentisphaerae bacterium]|nr:MAG: ATP-dependent Clp protease adapter ClpS [Lentisphaerota bacterium]